MAWPAYLQWHCVGYETTLPIQGIVLDLIRLFRHPFIPNSLWFRRLILPFLLLLDSYFGLSYGAGIISWTGLFTGDIKWFMLAVEMLVGALLIIRLILNQTNPKWRTAIIVSVPILVVLISFEILEVVLSGLGRSSTMNFNLSYIGPVSYTHLRAHET